MNTNTKLKNPFKEKWVKHGLLYGAVLYFVHDIVMPLFKREKIKTQQTWWKIPVWTAIGLAISYLIHQMLEGQNNNSNGNS